MSQSAREMKQEMNELSHVEVHVDETQMEAWIDVPAGSYAQLETVRTAIQQSGLRFGLRLTALREILQPAQEDRHIVLAQGQLRHDGEDGRLQVYVDDSLPYRIREDGSYDYHGASRIQTVEEGSPVAEIIEASSGASGMTVKGVAVHQHRGIEYQGSGSVIGEGTCLHNDGKIVAEQGGVLSRNRAGQLQVTPQLIIEGDVDLSVGNIDTDKPVLICGDIQSGFIVKSAADIVVQGVIEDSRVSAGGNLIVHQGILPGKERVKAHGELCAKYIQERRVECCDLVVESIIRHADISVRSSVHAQSIVGGTISAGAQVTVAELGNSSGEPGRVRVGVDDYVLACVAAVRHEREILFRQEKILREEIMEQCTSPEKKGVCAQTGVQTGVQTEKSLQLCLDEINLCDRSIACENAQIQGVQHASIEVTGAVYPGVEIGFGTLKKRSMISALTAVTFYCISDEIIVRV